MTNLNPADTAFLVKYEYEQPIEVADFVQSLVGINRLFQSYASKHSEYACAADSKLYVKEIREGSIDVLMVMASSLVPFMESVNLVLDFAGNIKEAVEYFTQNLGKAPAYTLRELKDLKDVFSVSAHNPTAQTSMGAVDVKHAGQVYNNCVFNYNLGNVGQNQVGDVAKELRENSSVSNVYNGVVMAISQMRKDEVSNAGNKAVIDDIFPGKPVPVLFADAQLKASILHSSANPTKRVYMVDVQVAYHGGNPIYKVLRLVDTTEIE